MISNVKSFNVTLYSLNLSILQLHKFDVELLVKTLSSNQKSLYEALV
jgi:hypothetical protein